jgi:hypothetical protein
MAQEWTNNALDVMLEATATGTVYVSAHTATPGLIGTNEHPLDGTPTYARQIASYDPASAGSMAFASSVTLDINGRDITYLGIWDAVTGGNFLGQVLIPTESFGSQGTLEVTALTLDLTNHP